MAAQRTSSSCAPHFDGTGYDYWKRKMWQNIKSRGRKIWGCGGEWVCGAWSQEPTLREEELLQPNDQALDMYDVEEPPNLMPLRNTCLSLDTKYSRDNTILRSSIEHTPWENPKIHIFHQDHKWENKAYNI